MDSLWWRGISGTCGIVGHSRNWFSEEGVRKKTGNGNGTPFWNEHWCGEKAPCLSFPCLLDKKNCLVRIRAVGRTVGGVGRLNGGDHSSWK